MYSRILVAIDGSEVAARALEHGLALALALGSAMTIVYVSEPAPLMGGGYAAVAGARAPIPEMLEVAETAAQRLLEKAKHIATAANVEAATVWVENRHPAEGIVETADVVGADLILMGTNGRRGLGRMILGSQTSNVLKHTKVPVLVTK